MEKRQGVSTLQMVRTKKPSAKKQTLNKCKNAGAKTLRVVRIKKPTAKSDSKESKDGCQKGGRRFFFPNPRHPSFDNPMRQRRARKGGTFFQEQNLRASPLRATTCQPKETTSKAQTPNLRNGDTNEPSARKGETFFLKFLALNS